jgi:V/A-type H+/Na+-transporting ATPase subunit A
VVGAVSPPGGDFSEPMTQNSMRVAGTFWALDYDLSRRRHFPAINWTAAFRSTTSPSDWYTSQVAEEWVELTGAAMALLQREVELLEIVQLVGPDALAETERAELAVARMLREDFLQQSLTMVDRFCPMDKAYWMLKTMMTFHRNAMAAVDSGIPWNGSPAWMSSRRLPA